MPRRTRVSAVSGSRKRPRRSAAYTSSYSESSDDFSDAGSDGTASAPEISSPRGRRDRPRLSERQHDQRQIALAPSRGRSADASRGLSRPLRSNPKDSTTPLTIRRSTRHEVKQVSGRKVGPSAIPTWPPGLPYEVLLAIFQYAVYPLWNEAFVADDSIDWLIKMALTCRDFTEPALSALYYSPPLYPPSRCYGLMALLRSEGPKYINYATKIRYLDVSIAPLPFKYDRQDAREFKDLVSLTPQIRGIGFHLVRDHPRLSREPVATRLAGAYPDSLFEQLGQSEIGLHQWKWTYAVSIGKEFPWMHLCEIHSQRAFANIRHLEILYLGSPLFFRLAKWIPLISELGNALALLSQLKSLTLNACDPQPSLFSKLPPLSALSFVNCRMLNSQSLSKILESHGRSLKELKLDHNRGLNLAFMGSLATSCPNLVTLKMDTTYYSDKLSVIDNEPEYATLLPIGVTPSWPMSLQSVEMTYLRKWGVEPSQAFFESLCNSAESLASLRRLVIRASVDMAWRERIKFRDKWIARLEHTFQRTSPPPLQRFSRGDFSLGGGSGSGQKHGLPPWEDVATCTANSSRLKTRQFAASRLMQAERDERVQGMCDVVDVRIDNLRPMEVQYHEHDFLDAETRESGR